MMKSKLIFLSFIICFSSITSYSQAPLRNGVVSMYEGGRLGDKLWSFANTLYFALKNNCDFYLVPFQHSDLFMMDVLLPKYSQEVERKYKYKETYRSGGVYMPGRKETLFRVPFFPDPTNKEALVNYRPSFEVNWEDPVFKAELRKLCTPKQVVRLIEPPNDKISVALHVRKGGTWDEEGLISADPEWLKNKGVLIYKIALDEFYINQLKKVSEIFNNAPLYVFIFTDHLKPEELVAKYTSALNNPNIEIVCRKNEPCDHCYNVLEDFFSMMHFDVLVRTQSCFSWMAEKLGYNKIVLSAGNEFIPGTWIQESVIDVKDQNFLKGIK